MNKKAEKNLRILEYILWGGAVLCLIASLQYRNITEALLIKLLLKNGFNLCFCLLSALAYVRTKKKVYIFDAVFFIFLLILNTATIFKRGLI